MSSRKETIKRQVYSFSFFLEKSGLGRYDGSLACCRGETTAHWLRRHQLCLLRWLGRPVSLTCLPSPPVSASLEVSSGAPKRLPPRRAWAGCPDELLGLAGRNRAIGAATGRRFSSGTPNKTIGSPIDAPTGDALRYP